MPDTFTTIRCRSIDSLQESEIIPVLKSLWITAKIATHTWFSTGIDLQYLPRLRSENIYASQIEITKKDRQDRPGSFSTKYSKVI